MFYLKELKNISKYIACKLLFMHHKNIKIVNIDKIVKVQVVLWLIKKRMYYKMFVKIIKRVLSIEPAFLKIKN